jgi:hypothetical protein
MEKLPLHFMPTTTKLTRLPALTAVHLTFSPSRVPQRIGQEFNICAKKKQGKSYSENTPHSNSGRRMKINLALTLEGKFIALFLCTLIFNVIFGGKKIYVIQKHRKKSPIFFL